MTQPAGAPADLVIIGNAMTRGNPCVEAVLENNIPYMSGPQWLHDFALRDRLGAGRRRDPRQNHHCRHGDLDLEACGYKPGFVIGGVPAISTSPRAWATARSL